jgi:hypothetical protein
MIHFILFYFLKIKVNEMSILFLKKKKKEGEERSKDVTHRYGLLLGGQTLGLALSVFLFCFFV